MEIGNEISQKIRSAIKAKLVDLGAYVDDELPDYIMVMVANKKTEAQMTQDLNLFLGVHTNKFTSWLHNLLCKLQSITADIDSSKEDQGIPTKEEIDLLSSAGKSKKQEAVKTGGVKKTTHEQSKPEEDNDTKITVEPKTSGKVLPSVGQSIKSDKVPVKSSVNVEEVEGKVIKRKRSTSEKGSKEEGCLMTLPVVTAEASESGNEEEPEIHLRPEHDEFEEEVIQEALKQKKALSSVDVRQVKEHSNNTGSYLDGVVKQALLHTEEKTERNVSPRRSFKRKSTELHDKSPEERGSVASRLGKKHRSLVSRVGAVIKRDVYDSEDEYDPFNPSVGSVASVVKVTERKSSIPVEMQPNKSLLLRAMKDAHKSIETASHRRAAKAVVRPMPQKDNTVSDSNRSVKDRLGAEHKVSDSASSRSIRDRLGAERKVSPGRSIQIVSRSSKESKRLFHRRSSEERIIEQEIKRKRRKSSEKKEKRSRYHSNPTPAEQSTDRNVETEYSASSDCRQVEITVTTQEEGTNEVEEDLLETLIQGEEEDLGLGGHFDEASGSRGSEDVKTLHNSIGVKASSETNPTFVVTLDGVDPNALNNEASLTDLATPDTVVSKNVGRVKPQRLYNAVNINLSEDDHDDDTDAMSATTATSDTAMQLTQKIQERCRFWPNCKVGDQCPYVHPTTDCLKFPSCHFGQKCLYIHPACKFDGSCTRPGCPFSHTVKKPTNPVMPFVVQPIRLPVYMPRPQAVTKPVPPSGRSASLKDLNCKFFPNCTNMNCTFRHPKPCRYGISCLNKETCYFYHPSLPNKAQLKWATNTQAGSNTTSPSKALASRSAAV